MKKQWIPGIALCALVVSLSALLVSSTLAQVKKGKTRPLQTKHLMRGLVKPQCSAIKKELDAKPGDDKAWESIELRAALLNEASHMLMADGRCPDAAWAEAAKTTLRQGSADILAAVESRDLEAARRAFGALTKSCKGCHSEHKK